VYDTVYCYLPKGDMPIWSMYLIWEIM
jgi:hypothetical protein